MRSGEILVQRGTQKRMGYKRLSCRVHSGIEGLIRKFPTILAEFALRAYDKILRTLGGEDMITTYFGAHMYCNTSDLIQFLYSILASGNQTSPES